MPEPAIEPSTVAVNLAAMPQTDYSRLSFRSVKTVNSLQSGRSTSRELLKQVKAHFYGKPPKESQGRVWTDKVLADLCKDFAVKHHNHQPGNEERNNKEDGEMDATSQSDQSGDSLEQPLPALMDNSASGDTSPTEEKPQEEQPDEMGQYRAFVEQLRPILSAVSGMEVSEQCLNLDQYRQVLAQYGLSSEQLLNQKFRLVYQPKVVVVRNFDEAKLAMPQSFVSQDGTGATLPDQAQSVKVVSNEVYFYPNGITFQ